jgi:intracellular multiplication protein IcmD
MKITKKIVTLSTLFFNLVAVKIASAATIGNLAGNVTSTFGQVAQVVTAGAYVAGFGFAVAAILKFKAHKDNPTQIPIGTPIALLLIAVALIFVPTIFGVTGATLFGSATATGGVTGVTSF